MSHERPKYGHKTLDEPFTYRMEDGTIFTICHIRVAYHRTFLEQLRTQGIVFMKFCIREDEEMPAHLPDNQELWEVVFFPMYRNGVEIKHGEIVPYEDSVLNGNLTVTDGCCITDASTNHWDEDYSEIRTPVLDFAKQLVEDILSESF